MDYIAQLAEAIQQLHGGTATYVETVPVKEVFQGKTLWEGEVEVFGLTGHPKAKKAFAWGYPSEKEPSRLEIVVVLEVPPITSPQRAVKATIVAEAKAIEAGVPIKKAKPLR